MFPIAGMVLCGGESTRMGRSKAWLPVGPELMLPRLVRLIGEVVSPIVVVAASDQALPGLPLEVTVVRDAAKGRGPLQGLEAGLTSLVGVAEAAFVSSCDVPFLRPAFVRRMIDLAGGHQICVPRVGERYHPLAGVYRVEVLEAVRRLLDEDRLRLTDLLDAVPTRVVAASELLDVDPQLASLRNVNTPEEYTQALLDLT